MPKLRDHSSIEARIYTRTRAVGAAPRHYADFRDFADVGGGLEKLAPDGANHATTCADEAQVLAQSRLAELVARRADAAARAAIPASIPTTADAQRAFGRFALYHLEAKDAFEEADRQWMNATAKHLTVARDFFGEACDLTTINVTRVTEFVSHLRRLPNGRGGTLSNGSIVQYLNSLSNMYIRAIAEAVVPPGHNPVRALPMLPKIARVSTPWLEHDEMVGLMRAARTYQPVRVDIALPCFFEVFATIALTGARETEVFGLERADLQLKRGVLRITKNKWRRLKNDSSDRSARIFTQLHEILDVYLTGPYAPKGRLLFPNMMGGTETMITDIRKPLDHLRMPERLRRDCTRAELVEMEAARQDKRDRWLSGRRGPKPEESLAELEMPIPTTVLPNLRTKMLRHTYCAARLQTLDGGKPISPWTVAAELGHIDLKMIQGVYGHLGKIRYRGNELDFR